jgi:hypothetical protein
MMTSVSHPPRLLQFGDRVEVPAGIGTVVAVDLDVGPDENPRFIVELDAGSEVTVRAGEAKVLELGDASTFAGELLEVMR